MTRIVFGCVVQLALFGGSAALINDDTPANEVPMIMTHDAGSGYLGSGLVNRWTKTQPAGLAAQLECGARAFDARPLLKDGRVVWHHGQCCCCGCCGGCGVCGSRG